MSRVLILRSTRRRFMRMAAGFGLSVAGLPALAGCGDSARAAKPARRSGRAPRLGVLAVPPDQPFTVNPFFERLGELGYIGSSGSIQVLRRSAEETDPSLPRLAAELAGLGLDGLFANSAAAAHAARMATSTVPIVMVCEVDPVRDGLVAALGRPGGNVTGVTTLATQLGPKRLQLLTAAVPQAKRTAVLWYPDNAGSAAEYRAVQAEADTLEIELLSAAVRTPAEFTGAIERAVAAGAGGLLVSQSPLTSSTPNRTLIASLVQQRKLPAIWVNRSDIETGGLMAYGADPVAVFARAGDYVDKIIRGVRPANLPVEQPTRFSFVLNESVATAIGVTFPRSILAQATEVIR